MKNNEIKSQKTLIPVCCNCKKTFEDDVWKDLPLEDPDNHTHGICPECTEILYARFLKCA